jgi:hypothetical protein
MNPPHFCAKIRPELQASDYVFASILLGEEDDGRTIGLQVAA